MKYTFWTIGILALAIGFGSQLTHGQTQADMNEQAARDAQKADDALNATYKELLAQLDAKGQEKLKTAQRAWLKFRDAEADLTADQYRGGSILPMIYSQSLQRLTEARTAQLKAHINDRKEP